MRSAAHRSGAILLEVLISLGLMVFGLAIVGLQVSTSLETARKSQLWTTSIVLTETKMAELQAGAVQFKATDQEVGGYFGIRYPGYSWHIHIEPCEIENLYMMTLQIGYNPSAIESQIANPDQEIDFDDQGTQILRTVHRLVPKPADLDLNRDFGIDLAGLQDQMGGGGQGGGAGGGEGGEGSGGGDGASELWGLISDFLTQHPEILNDSGGIDLEAIKNLPPEDFQAAMEILQQFVGRGSQLSQLQDQLGDALGEEDKGGKNGGSRNGNNNGNNGNNNDDGQNEGGGTVDGDGNTGGGNRPNDRRPRPDRDRQNPDNDDENNRNNQGGGGPRNFGGPGNNQQQQDDERNPRR